MQGTVSSALTLSQALVRRVARVREGRARLWLAIWREWVLWRKEVGEATRELMLDDAWCSND